MLFNWELKRNNEAFLSEKSIAVIMSIYHGDNLKDFKLSINSLLSQSHKNFTIFLYVDGEVSEDLMAYVQNLDSEIIQVHYGNKNKGLAHAMNYLVDYCLSNFNFDYFARMDADDISHRDRLSIQLSYAENNLCDVLGADVIEIDHLGNELFYKQMLTGDNELKASIIKRCPFNHPTVVISKKIFLDGHRYDASLKNTQDYFLWVDLALAGYKFGNINQPLLKFRISEDFYSKRGVKKAKNDFNAKIAAIKKLSLPRSNYIYAVAIFLLRISPVFIQKLAYDRLR